MVERTRQAFLIMKTAWCGFVCSLSPKELEVVNRPVFAFEVAHVGCRVDLGTGHTLDELLGLELVAMAVDLLPQPGEPGSEITPADLIGQVGDFGVDAFPQLSADQVAQGIAGEISNQYHPTSAHPATHLSSRWGV